MKTTFAVLALAAAAYAAPQGVTATIAPSAPAPAGCTPSYSGSFNIANINVTTSSKHKRELAERQLSGTLTLTLSNGILKDQAGRTGYIAANRQFQFDNPPQTGAIYTSGFSACANSTLALGGSTIFYQCYSGGFYNLYDQATGNQCSRIYFQILPVASGSSAASSAAATSAGATVRTDGQPIVSTARSSVVSQITDGQPQASSARTSVISQISDGQPQATTARASAISQISDGQPQASSAARISQISDGQPQATTAARISQISDGQPQATTAARISQISDGQPQATTAARISQISDGQPQASSAARTTGAVVSQISDGQPQATRAANSTTARISQISDGQPQATRAGNGTTATPTRAAATSSSPAAFTGAAQPVAVANFFAIAAGAAAVALL